MAELKPCGTLAAAKRHRRKGEPLDEACRQAENAARAARRARPADDTPAEVPVELPAEIDPLTEARENLAIIKRRMATATPTASAALSKRWQELATLVYQLEHATKGKTLEDELAARRDSPAARRRAARRAAGA